MEKLNFFGIGPKIGRIILPWLAITIILTILFPFLFKMGLAVFFPLFIAGSVLVVFALVFYFATLKLMLPGIKENRLITTGAYRYTRNPLYAAIVLFLIPGVALMMNSWLVLTVPVLGWVVLKRYIHEEEEMLERIFGDEFRAYRDRTPFLFPNPFVKKF